MTRARDARPHELPCPLTKERLDAFPVVPS